MIRRDEEREARYLANVAALREATEPAGDAPPTFAEIAAAVRRRRAEPARPSAWPGAWRLGLASGVGLAAAAAVLLALLLPGPGEPEPTDGLHASEVEGRVAVVAPDGRRPLWQADALEPGVRLETADAASTTLLDSRIARVDVGERTVVRIGSWSRKRSVLELEHGQLQARVVPREAGETFLVTTPCGRVEVVGTVFVVEHQPKAGTRVTTHEGVVKVRDVSGADIARLTAGGAVSFGPAGCTDAPPGAEETGHDATPLAAGLPGVGVAPPGVLATVPQVAEAAKVAEVAEVAESPVGDVAPTPSAAAEPIAVVTSEPESEPEPEPTVAAAVEPGRVAPTTVLEEPDEKAEGPAPRRMPRTRRSPVTPVTPVAEVAEVAEVAPAMESGAPEAIETTPAERAMAAYTDARALLGAGDDARAIALLDEALSAPGPHRARLLALLGDARRVAGRHQAAREAYEAAIEDGGAGAQGAAIDLATLCEKQLHAPSCARDAWSGYLAREPEGRAAARALLARARLAAAAGDTGSARADWRRLLADHARSREATHALVLLGRSLLDANDWAAAEALFGAWTDAPGARGEEALVGLLRVRLGQGRSDAARALAIRHRDRFPDGARRADVDAIFSRLAGGHAP